MTTYIKYQCTVCRRTKDIERDNVRVMPNECTITKGCSGELIATTQSSVQSPLLPVDGLTDWYPRATSKISTTEAPSKEELVGLTTSSSGAFVIAVRANSIDDLPDSIDVTFLQRRANAVGFTDYVYKTTDYANVFTGKDVGGKILRVTPDAISEGRIQVRVNGVIDATANITQTTVTTTNPVPPGGIVNIRIQQEKDTIERSVTLVKNVNRIISTARGSWANVQSVNRFENGAYTKWFLFSIDTLTDLGVGRLTIFDSGTTNPSIILLAHSPYTYVDRYLQFIIDVDAIVELDDLVLSMDTNSSDSFSIPKSLVTNVYPPLQVEAASLIGQNELFTSASSLVVTNGSNQLLTSSKIIGPV